MERQKYSLRDDVTVEAIEREVDKLWSDLHTDESLRAEARRAGIDLGELPRGSRDSAITIEKTTANFAGAEILIGLGVKIAYDVWKELILPRLRQRFGSDSIRAVS
jgi:hypothetical protein